MKVREVDGRGTTLSYDFLVYVLSLKNSESSHLLWLAQSVTLTLSLAKFNADSLLWIHDFFLFFSFRIGFHSLTNDKNSNLEFSSQFSYVIASGVQISFSWFFVQGKGVVECRAKFLLSAKRLEIMQNFYCSSCSKKGLHPANHGILFLLIL